jgi:hypothetical protein
MDFTDYAIFLYLYLVIMRTGTFFGKSRLFVGGIVGTGEIVEIKTTTGNVKGVVG